MLEPSKVRSRVDCMDGLRGLAAVWVLVGHATLLTGFHIPVVSYPDLGVDLFVMLSGFLMVFHYQLRSAVTSVDKPADWLGFWLRRFFRIAPLFYVLLPISLLLGPMLFADRELIDTFLGGGHQAAQRYLDSNPTNLLLHLTFLFGLVPAYSFRTPLPDWSLGLEMQFYAMFPFLMIGIKRIGWINGAIAIALLAGFVAAVGWVIGIDFPMPSFLPLKMNVFLCGMLLAAATSRPDKAVVFFVLSAVLISFPLGGDSSLSAWMVRELTMTAFYGLTLGSYLKGAIGDLFTSAGRILGNRFFHWLGELSFGAYLIHLPIVHIASAFMIRVYAGSMMAPLRFAVVAAITIPATYGLSLCTYKAIERPGQRLGAKLINWMTARPDAARSDAAEKIAAP